MIPARLQALKDQAAAVRDEQIAIAKADAEKWWEMLTAVAEESLGPLWEFVIDKEPPPGFREHHHGFIILLPGHRRIYAPFDARDDQWYRSRYHARPSDEKDGVANWMVETQPGRDLPSYHQTLGSALLAAEI